MKTGLLLTNLGTPTAPTFWAVRRYLKEFLSDPAVIDLPRWQWLPILNLVILTIRPWRSAHKYRKIWTNQGSPLLIYSNKIAAKLALALPDMPVAVGMRYGEPSLASALAALAQQGVQKPIVLPLYPQYSKTTTGTTIAALPAKCTVIQDYHDHPLYIEAIVNSIKQFWQRYGQPEKLLLSYHGLPKRYITQGDPYYAQCQKTSTLIREALGVNADFAPASFQSRIGFETWLQPYTKQTIETLAKQGLKNLQVICPGFACDCLETLEEIDILHRSAFLKCGGEHYHYIPALNDSDAAIALFKNLLSNDQLNNKEP